jgi:hypothetical protein
VASALHEFHRSARRIGGRNGARRTQRRAPESERIVSRVLDR